MQKQDSFNKTEQSNAYQQNWFYQQFRQLRSKLQNKIIQNNPKLIKKVMALFSNYCFSKNKKQLNLLFILNLLNFICFYVLRQTKQNKILSFKYIKSSKQFVRHFIQTFQSNIQKIDRIKNSISIKKSILFFFQQLQKKREIQNLKIPVLNFLSLKFVSDQMTFRLFDIVKKLQDLGHIQAQDFPKYKITQNISKHLKQLNKHQKDDEYNEIIYSLAFQLLIKGNCHQETYRLFKQLNIVNKPFIINAFMISIFGQMDILPNDFLIQITKQFIFLDKFSYMSVQLFYILGQGLEKMDFISFQYLIENQLLTKILNKWGQAKNNNLVDQFFFLIDNINDKAEHTHLSEAVYEFIQINKQKMFEQGLQENFDQQQYN